MMSEKQYEVMRDIPEMDLKKGDRVWDYFGCTYGCIDTGIAVSRERGKTPFKEVQREDVRLTTERED